MPALIVVPIRARLRRVLRLFAALNAWFELLVSFAQRLVRLALDVLSAPAQASMIVVAAALVRALAAALNKSDAPAALK